VICTSTTAVVWGLDRKVFRNLIARVAADKADSNSKLLANFPLFEGLDENKRGKLVDVVIPVHFQQGENIVQQGDEGNTFYIIKSGSVNCTDDQGNGAALQLDAGQYFGELALINNAPRARTVVAREASELLALGRKDFQDMLGSVKDALQKEAGYRVLKSCSLFPDYLSSSVRDNICEAFELREYTKGHVVVKANEMGDSMYVVGEGSADAIVDGNVVKTYNAGEYFGEICLTSKDTKRTATITVTSDTIKLYELGREPFNTHMGPMKKSIEKIASDRKSMTELKTIPYEELTFNRNLGQGTFGLVKLMSYRTKTSGDKKVFALKCMQKQQIVNYKLAGNVLYEKQMMVESDHPFVLKLYKTYQSADSLMMLLEIVPGGELFTYLQGCPGNHVSSDHARFIGLCVVAVFDYIHEKGICYRDLKPENLMIDADGYIKMVDFGFAKIVKNKTFTLCGTPEYMAPEIILRKGHAKGVDYWATGILIWECETGETPFADYENYDNRVICENILRLPIRAPRGVKKDVVDILIGDRDKAGSTGLINRRVSKRLGCLARGARDIIEKSYFSGINYQKLLCREIEAPYKPNVGSSGIDQRNFDPIDDGPPIEKFTGKQEVFEKF
jgi:CRP-like cAMP-binding protein